MLKRNLRLLLAICLTLLPGLMLNPWASFAIDKVTATPTPDEPLDVDAALDEIRTLLGKADYDGVIELAGEILLEDEAHWEAYYYRGFARARQEDWDDAIADYDIALELRPFDAQLWRLRGDMRRQNSDPRGALADYERGLFFNPRSTQTYVSLARLHERDRDKTLRDLYQSIINAGRASRFGNSYRAVDILDQAIEGVERRTRLSQLGYAYYQRANVWTNQAEWDNALADVSVALELQPGMQDYYMTRGYIYSQTEQRELAAPDFFRRMTLIERETVDGELTFAESVTIKMNHGVVARLRFEGEAGQSVTISARDHLGDGVDPLLVLLDVAGVPIAGDDDGGGELDALIADIELPAAGVYTALVSHANGGYEGEVRVSLR